jgi:hypothetical protein
VKILVFFQWVSITLKLILYIRDKGIFLKIHQGKETNWETLEQMVGQCCIKLNIKGLGYEGVKWICVAQARI